MQLLSIHYKKNSGISCLSIAEAKEDKSQVDDAINDAIKVINTSSLASGLNVNISKCELCSDAWTDTSISGVPVKHRVLFQKRKYIILRRM